MSEIAYNILNNQFLLDLGAWLGLPLSIVLLILFSLKGNRDERGWKIIGKASIITFLYFFIAVNAIASITGSAPFFSGTNFVRYANTIQWLYNSVILVEISAILILKRFE